MANSLATTTTLKQQPWDFYYVKSALDKITQLNDVESLEDPEDIPFRSKYAAREELESLRKKLDTFIESNTIEDSGSRMSGCVDLEVTDNCARGGGNQNQNEQQSEFQSEMEDPTLSLENININCDDNSQTQSQPLSDSNSYSSSKDFPGIADVSRVEIFLRYIEGKLGLNFIECEETSSGEEHLSRALKCLTSKFDSSTPWTAYVHVYLINQLGILQAARRENEKAAAALHQARKTYESYKAKHSEAPLFPTDLLAPFAGTADENDEQSKWKHFEREHTLTLYYLAQVYQKADDGDQAAHYCQITLRRQLEMKEYNPVEWALNAATLSQYYITENELGLAKHCLASAMKIFEEAGPYEANNEEGGLFSRSVDLKRCWVKYGLALLEISWMRLVSDETTSVTDQDEKNADFFDLELTFYENWMPNKSVLDFDQARAVFLKIQEFISEAKTFYTIDDFCSDFIELVQDHSRAFKNLTIFEADSDRQSKMHKRRADMLEEVTKELNPQYYLLVWRQLVYETAEVYSAMVDCKVDIMNELQQQRPTQHAINKMNSLCEKSILKYLEYVASLKTADGTLPEPLPEGDERPALVAWFCIARLYYKMIKPDVPSQIECIRKTLLYYTMVVGACDKNSKYAKLMEAELPVCREMVTLLPMKIAKLNGQLQQ